MAVDVTRHSSRDATLSNLDQEAICSPLAHRCRAVADMMLNPRLRLLAILTGIVVIAVALASVLVMTRSSGASRVPAVSSSSPATPAALAPTFSRSEAEAAARQWASGVIMSEASKLSTDQIISAFMNAWESGQTTVGLPGRLNPRIGPPADREEWVVALSGSISRSAAWEPEFLPPGNIPWAVITYDATTGQPTGGWVASPSSAVTWPPGWDEIYDMAG